jgi:mannose-1-phosphate guanylyltransferase/phosphomannomutase
VFFREDYRRPSPLRLGELEFPPRALQQYATGLVGLLDVEAIRHAGLKIVVDYAYGPYSAIGPAVLGRLGCDVLALNAFTDEQRPALTSDELDALLAELADHVKNSGSHLGALIEPGGDVLHVVDDRGRLVSQERTLLAFIKHEARAGARRFALPVSTSIAAESLAKEDGAIVQWTPTSVPALMARAGRGEVGFAGNSEGTLIWPAFMAAPDGLMTLCKVLELAARNGSVSDVIDALPEVHIEVRDVPTPWSSKGAVMRYVATAAPPGQLTLLDGVKVVEAPGRWALVIPYSDEPLCRIWAEGRTDEEAREIVDRYARLVEEAVAAP